MNPIPNDRALIDRLLASGRFFDLDRQFLEEIRPRHTLTPAQLRWLDALVRRVGFTPVSHEAT